MCPFDLFYAYQKLKRSATAINLVYIGLLLADIALQSDDLIDIIDNLQNASWPLSLMTNMVATSFITYKAW